MKLTATTIDAETGELLPVYRDAYLRGDLARSAAQGVEDYLRCEVGTACAAAPVWAGQPPRAAHGLRFRRRAISFVLVSLLLAGASMTAHQLPAANLPTSVAGLSATGAPLAAIEAGRAHTVVLHGRILNEQGQPLAGVAVRQKGTAYGTRTDAAGRYSLRVPAGSLPTLQYEGGGYARQERTAFGLAAR